MTRMIFYTTFLVLFGQMRPQAFKTNPRRIIEKNTGRFLAKIDDRPRVAPGPSSSGLARSGGKDKEALVKSEHKEYEYYDDDDDDDDTEGGCEGDHCEYDYYDDEDSHDRDADDQYYEYYEETGDDKENSDNKGEYYYYYYDN